MSVLILILSASFLSGFSGVGYAADRSSESMSGVFIASDFYFPRPVSCEQDDDGITYPEGTAPVPLQPPDRVHFTKGDPVPIIGFSPVTSAIGYQIEFSLMSDFSSSSRVDLTETTLDLGKWLTADDWNNLSFVLYWRVRAQHVDRTWTDWSEGWWFSKSILSAPEEVIPETDARFGFDDTLPIITWDEYTQTHTFDVEIGADAGFNNSWGFIRVTEPLLDFADLFNLQTIQLWYDLELKFYWRVYAVQSNGVQSPPSDARAMHKSTIDKPDLVEPDDHSKYSADSTNLPNLIWEPVNEAVSYHLQIVYGDDDFSDGIPSVILNATNFNFADYLTTTDWQDFFGQLRWRVSAVRADGLYGSFCDEFDLTKIGRDRYMGFGDSITGGFGSSNFGNGFAGYPPRLRDMLRGAYGNHVQVLCEQDHSWFPGGHAYTGADNVSLAMQYHAPDTVLIMFGIVDLIDSGATGCDDHDCHTIEHLSSIVNQVIGYHASPYVATLTPVNPDSDRAFLQEEIDTINAQIRVMCAQMSVPLVDLDEAFEDTPLELPEYFYEHPDETQDWAHFNDDGYEIIANTWYDALTN